MEPSSRIIHALEPRGKPQGMSWSICSDAGQGVGKAVTLRSPPHPCAVARKVVALTASLLPAPSQTVATSDAPCWRPAPFYPGTDPRSARWTAPGCKILFSSSSPAEAFHQAWQTTLTLVQRARIGKLIFSRLRLASQCGGIEKR